MFRSEFSETALVNDFFKENYKTNHSLKTKQYSVSFKSLLNCS